VVVQGDPIGSAVCRIARRGVARQLGRTGAVVYDRAGVVGMLLSLRHAVSMQRFLELNLGSLLHEEEKQRSQLMHTLRVFFDVNCWHGAASRRLGVHPKTIAHRLAKISELTGLDLTTHDDRLSADLPCTCIACSRAVDRVSTDPDAIRRRKSPAKERPTEDGGLSNAKSSMHNAQGPTPSPGSGLGCW